MNWNGVADTLQWVVIYYLVWRGAKNENRMDLVHENVEFLLFTIREKLGVWKAERKDKP